MSASQRSPECAATASVLGGQHTERGQNGRHVCRGRGLVAGDRDPVGVGRVQVDPGPLGLSATIAAARPGTSAVTVSKKASGASVDAGGAQPGRERRGVLVRSPGDPAQPVRAVVDRVHAGDHGQQYLRRADVAGRLLAADVLLAGLQREPVGGCAVRVLGHTDETAGQ